LVDAQQNWVILLVPPDGGLLKPIGRGSLFSYILGLQIGTQFCPDKINGSPPEADKLSFESDIKLSFFVSQFVQMLVL